MSTSEDLAETVKLVEEMDRRVVAIEADVCDVAALRAAVEEGVAELGGVDIVLGNAGIVQLGGLGPRRNVRFSAPVPSWRFPCRGTRPAPGQRDGAP